MLQFAPLLFTVHSLTVAAVGTQSLGGSAVILYPNKIIIINNTKYLSFSICNHNV